MVAQRDQEVGVGQRVRGKKGQRRGDVEVTSGLSGPPE